MKENRIEISLEEYKELLVIKGRYEELLKPNKTIIYIPIQPTPQISPYWYSTTTDTRLLKNYC